MTAHQNGRFEKTFSATFINKGAVVKNHYNHHNSPVLQWTWLSKSYSKINVRSSSDDHLITKYIKYLGCCFYLHSFDFSTTIIKVLNLLLNYKEVRILNHIPYQYFYLILYFSSWPCKICTAIYIFIFFVNVRIFSFTQPFANYG